jgi:hypothetical protein
VACALAVLDEVAIPDRHGGSTLQGRQRIAAVDGERNADRASARAAWFLQNPS